MVHRKTSLRALLLLACAIGIASESMFTMDWSQKALEPEKGVNFFMMTNPLVTANLIDCSVVMVDLPPCALRTMHIHMNTDELHYALQGTFLAMCALPNGTVISDTIFAGQGFIAPKNHIHSMINPSCTESATFMGFYNTFSANNNNVGAGVLHMVNSPFAEYVAPQFNESLQNAVGLFGYDPVCLKRCGLGEKGGQLPVERTVF